MSIHDYESAVAFLMGRINYERTTQIPYRSRDFKLQRMERLLARLGNPHFEFPAVHIAGTKGKGSTAAMVDAILRAEGLRTGLYTSPHLERIEERFAIDGRPCSADDFVAAAQQVEAAVAELDARANGNAISGPTYFEITTAIGMLIFARANVDLAVLEVGLGGRLDSTNVCRPRVSVITSISFDHTQQLGNTIESIATEKAGIIKPSVPVVNGATHPQAAEVVRETAHRVGSPVYEQDVDFGYRARGDHQCTVWLNEENIEFDDFRLAMFGRHQFANAALAVIAARLALGQDRRLMPSNVCAGLAGAVCPARIEIIRRHPPIVLDAAHNVASCEALVRAIDESFSQYHRRTLILATSNDKDVSGMLRTLLPSFTRIVFTRYLDNPRSASPETLLRRAKEIMAAHVTANGTDVSLASANSPAEALAMVNADASGEELLCVAGSFFLAAEIRSRLREMAGDSALPALQSQ